MRIAFACALLALASVASLAGGQRLPRRDLEIRDASDRVWIEGGWFRRGTRTSELQDAVSLCLSVRRGLGRARCDPQVYQLELPARRVYVSRFGLDRVEVSNEAWRACVRGAGCPPPRMSESDPRVSGDRMPVTGVTWREAQDYCAFVGGRLPTETEWERAARGPTSRVFPWGRVYNDRLANHGTADGQPDPIDGFPHAAPVGSFPDGASADGVLDLAGNVWEWTADAFDGGDEWATELPVDPRGAASGGERMVRGGSWRSGADALRSAARIPVPAGVTAPDLGFRCAYD